MKSYYDKGYSKGLTLGRVIRYYDDEVLGNIAHKMSDFDNHEQSMTELMRGLRHGIEEQEERRKHKMPMASARNPDMDPSQRFAAIAALKREMHAEDTTDERSIEILKEIRRIEKGADKPPKRPRVKKDKEQYMDVLGGYVLDMKQQGLLVGHRDAEGRIRDHFGKVIENPSSEGRIVRRVVTVSNPSNPSKLRPWMEGDVLGTLKYGRFLYHMGNYVYVAYLNTDSEPPVIQGKRISEFEYTNLLDWNRANVYNMHGTNVITVPWAGGTREFTFRGDERFPVIETGPETQAPKEKKVKGIERYKGYYINSFGRGNWWAALESSAVASEKAAKDEADYGPRSSLPELKALIDAYGGSV